MGRRIYVETLIHAPPARVWDLSQQPDQHQRWDLRFQRIEYLPRDSDTAPQRFRYATAGVAGTGISTGERHRRDGSSTSSLRFASPSPLSPIVEGAGYWKYAPSLDGDGAPDGPIRFLTGYDYAPRYPILDRAFRPAMGWATAWSFDRLRLWLEDGVTPERALAHAAAEVGGRVALVAAASARHPLAGVAAAVVAVVVPPHRLTPSARRCLRRPPDHASDTPPTELAHLEAA